MEPHETNSYSRLNGCRRVRKAVRVLPDQAHRQNLSSESKGYTFDASPGRSFHVDVSPLEDRSGNVFPSWFGDQPVTAAGKLKDVSPSGSPTVLSIHRPHHRRRARSIFGGGDQQQGSALRVVEFDGISDTQGRLEIDPPGCRHDVPIKRFPLLRKRQGIRKRR